MLLVARAAFFCPLPSFVEDRVRSTLRRHTTVKRLMPVPPGFVVEFISDAFSS